MQTEDFDTLVDMPELERHGQVAQAYQSMQDFANLRFFAQPEEFYSYSPFRRPVRPQDIDICLLGRPLDLAELSHPNHLLAQRLLMNIYEQDMVFLPNEACNFKLSDFKDFYDPDFVAAGCQIRPALERYVFDWLGKKVHVGGGWTLGYGVHPKKHSTIFENMLRDTDLSADIHHYWQFYTASSISLINYFHYVSANHGSFFRYIGALYYTEASLAFTTKPQSEAIRRIFDGKVSTLYFDEHTHIDVHHGRMALEKLITPLVKQYGDSILSDILRGFEEFRLLQTVADDDLYAHIAWHDSLDELKAEAAVLRAKLVPDPSFTKGKGELSVTHTHPVDELFWVSEGQMELRASPLKSVVLSVGEGIIIRQGMLHGSKVLSDSCNYSVTALKTEHENRNS